MVAYENRDAGNWALLDEAKNLFVATYSELSITFINLKSKKFYIVISLLVVAAIAVWIYYYYFQESSAVLVATCPSRSIFGIYCPGCGSQRALAALLHGDFRQSFQYNPMLIPSLLLLAVIGFGLLKAKFYPNSKPSLFQKYPKIAYAIFALLILYMVLRNIPIAALECLRPPNG